MDKRAWACCRHSLRTLIATPRIWAVLILCVLCIDRYLAPITDMMTAEGARISWAGLAVFLLNDSWVSAMAALGLLILLFDVPRRDEAQKYLLMRAGRRAWARGQLYYVLCAAALYMAALGLILLAWIAPWIDWTSGWSPTIEQFVKDGIYTALNVTKSYDMGYKTVEVAVAAIEGTTVEGMNGKFLDSGSIVVTQDNVESEEAQSLLHPFG